MKTPIQELLKDTFYFPQLGVTIEKRNELDELLSKLFSTFNNDPKEIVAFLQKLNKRAKSEVLWELLNNTVLTDEDKKNHGYDGTGRTYAEFAKHQNTAYDDLPEDIKHLFYPDKKDFNVPNLK